MALSNENKLSKSEKRRIAILNVAEQLFLSKGFSDVTLDIIISQAGGSRRVVYEHFGNKTGLLEAVCKRIFKQVDQEFDIIHDTDSNPRETLTHLGENLLKVLTSYPTLPLFELTLSENRRFPAIGEMFYEAVPNKAYAVLASYIDRQIALGTLRSVDSGMAARQFFGMIREGVHLKCILQPGYHPNDQEIRDVVAGAVDLFLSALSVN